MASSARIEELRKKFEENPRRYFAPLANEHRKAGDIDQAIAICREYLPQQPGHMSGHIVYGQALYEARQFEEAKSVFETALTLDPENLIALRHLGDIALIVGDADAAKGWYRRVLEADPRNEEIQAQLATLDRTSSPSPSSSAPPAQPAVTADSPTAEIRLDSVSVGKGSEGRETAAGATTIADLPTLEPIHSADAEAHAALTSESAATAPTERLELDSVVPGVPPSDTPPSGGFSLDGLETTSLANPDAAAAEASSTATVPESVSPASTLELDMPSPDALPSASGADPATESSLTGSDASPAIADQPGSAEQVELLDLSIGSPSAEPEHLEETAARPAPDAGPFVTETMAELYLQQGHREEALRVYRALLDQRPGDASLRDKVESLQQPVTSGAAGAIASERLGPATPAAPASLDAVSAPTIREILSLVAMRRPGHRLADSATEHNGSTPAVPLPVDSLAALFAGAEIAERDEYAARMLALAFSADGAAGAGGIVGAPARVASGELSLDAVFSSAPAPASNFSFDQFFSGSTQDTGGRANPDTPSAESPEDVAQFTQWLQGLKQR